MEKILLTGQGGFLGSIIKKTFTTHGITMSDLIDSEGGKIDIKEPFSFKESFDIILHAAGKAHSVPRTVEEERAFYQVNYEGTKNLCAAINQLPKEPKAFIFISTVAVYGVDSGELIHEDAPLIGKSAYAKSKILAEEWLKGWAKKNSITLGILRLPLAAGPNPPGNLGAMVNGIRSGHYLSIGEATARKSVVWAEDIAQIIPKLAKVGGVFNLTDGYHPNFGELENAISGSLGKRNPFKIPMAFARLLGFAGDVLGDGFPVNSDKLHKITSTLTFDDHKARRLLGWNPSKVLDKIPMII